MTATVERRPIRRATPAGLAAMATAILCFSISSSLVKKAGAPGPTIAFWRLTSASVLWTVVLRVTEHRRVTRAELRRALLPGVAFGLNITFFFTAITHTSVANAEFIGALTPLLVVPLGALLLHEHVDPRALVFGVLSLAGLALVLFGGSPGSGSSWTGNAFAFMAMGTWTAYMFSTRALRSGLSVTAVMASAMPIASMSTLPIVLVRGEITTVTWHAALYIGMLTVLTGTVAHGLIVFAQHHVPIGTISILQVAQPAIAVFWSVVLLDATINGRQGLGMALVIAGIVLVTLQTQRRRSAD